jgi:large subunit ribosomal protein L10
MTVSRLNKDASLASLIKYNKSASSGFIVNFSGISSNEMNEIRRKLHNSHLHGFVAKNTLIKKAINEIDITDVSEAAIKQLKNLISGRHLVVFGNSHTWEATKDLKAIIRDHKQLSVSFMFAVDGVVGDSAKWLWYSSLPTMPEARLSLASELYRPLMSLVSTLTEAFNLPSNE